MKDLRLLDQYRSYAPEVVAMYGSTGDGTCGVFAIPSVVDGSPLLVIASAGGGWDHVSVSRPNRCPNWPEMDHVKRLFFRDDEVAMQLHVAARDHISVHPNCLHLWRPQAVAIPLPPPEFVA